MFLASVIILIILFLISDIRKTAVKQHQPSLDTSQPSLRPDVLRSMPQGSILDSDGEQARQSERLPGEAPFSENYQPSTSVSSLHPLTQSRSPDTLSGDSFLGHFFYPEPIPPNLMLVTVYAQGPNQRFEFLNVEAGIALMKMIHTARDEGIWLIPTSAFRGFDRQQELFENQVKRRGSEEEAAKLSAPPGYSEHHTGYAVDLADGHFPGAEFSPTFADTDTYKWLQKNAEKFGFELSFPLNNAQGVSFEPWHWRFIDSPEAQEIFARARN